MELSYQNKKIELIQWLTTLKDESIIQQLIEVRNTQIKDWWGELLPEEIESIENGIKDAENENLINHTKVRKAYEK